MSNFINSEYETGLANVINDIFYCNTSYRGKIGFIRILTEYLVRKLTDYPSTDKMMLGYDRVKNMIADLPYGAHIQECVDKIKNDIDDSHGGDTCLHTERVDEVSEEEYNCILDALSELYACLFIKYFADHEFGSNDKIMSEFSLLPPNIRYKTLIFLYNTVEDAKSNVHLIDRLVLSMKKALGNEEAYKWVEERKAQLEGIPSVANIDKTDPIQVILALNSPNMYQCCLLKIKSEYPERYKTFEEAKTYYLEFGGLDGTTNDIFEFNDIMEFVFMGRKEA